VALYEALYGDMPFAGESVEELRANVAAEKLREPPRGTRVPAWLAPSDGAAWHAPWLSAHGT